MKDSHVLLHQLLSIIITTMNGISLASSFEKAYAKLNLRLKIEGRRPDGYHLLNMINARISLVDEISVGWDNGQGVKIQVTGDISPELRIILEDPARNIAGKVASHYLNALGIRRALKISIRKQIPDGAGLGGGSSDAAAVLLEIMKLVWGEEKALSKDKEVFAPVHEIGLKAGADVPYFLYSGLAHVSGIGDVVQELPDTSVAGEGCTLLVPKERVNTARLYELLRSRKAASEFSVDHAGRKFVDSALKEESLKKEDLLSLIENDLEPFASEICPSIAGLLTALRGISGVRASLTGSGSAIFAFGWNPGNCAKESADSELWRTINSSETRIYEVKLVGRGKSGLESEI